MGQLAGWTRSERDFTFGSTRPPPDRPPAATRRRMTADVIA